MKFISNLKEPLSFFTNLAYFIVGCFAAFIGSNPLLAISLIFLSAGSAAFHYAGSLVDTSAHRADEGAIYAVLCSLLLTVTGFNPFLVVLGALGMFVLIFYMQDIDLFKWAPILCAAIVLALAINYGILSALPAAVVGLAAYLVRAKLPDSDWQHAAWHCLSAGAIYLAWEVTI